MSSEPQKLRSVIARRVKRLRLDRRWTQHRLAEQIGLSQNRLSEVENGKGSFTAEQLVTILKLFNVPLDEIVPPQRPAGDQLHKALARLGATHLSESVEVLPAERLKDVYAVIPEVLASGDPRQITALAPVLVNHAESLGFTKVHADCASLGVLHRFDWVVENTVAALEAELKGRALEQPWISRYQAARSRLQHYLDGYLHARPEAGLDLLDHVAASARIDEIEKTLSKISKRWNIVSRLQVEDFRQALEAAR